MPDILALIEKVHIVHSETDLDAILRHILEHSNKNVIRVGFFNAHAVNTAYNSEEFYNDLLSCDYIFRDGAGIKILYVLLGRRAGLNLNGTDLIPKILDICKGSTIAVFGTKSPYLENSATKLKENGLLPVLCMDGFHADNVYNDALQKEPANIVLLGMGMPKQERVARSLSQSLLHPTLIICGGAILDFIGEKVSRAPKTFRRFGFEWFYRLMQEPRRLFFRYSIGNITFLYRAFKIALKERSANTDRLKILHVVRQYHPAIGGLETYVRSMTKHQQDLGHDCTVLTLNKVFQGEGTPLPADDLIDGIKIRRVPFWGKRRYFFPFVSPFYFKNFDIVHVHNTDFFYDYVGFFSFVLKFRAFATTHGGFFHTKEFSFIKNIYFKTVTKITSKFYKVIFAISENDYNTFKNMNKNVIVQPNAIEPLGKDIYSGEDFIYIGRLATNKNIPDLLRVFSCLKNFHGIKGNLQIVGPDWDISTEDLYILANSLNIKNHVFFHGALTSEKLNDVAQTCGYFLSASLFEGFGMSMLEAMTVGIIPMVHKNKAFEELVKKSNSGICVDYTKPEKSAALIAAFLPTINQTMRSKAQLFSLSYSWPSLVQNTDEIYKGYIK